jgi:GntR family transcriptional regulator/MocR family aminotransferase
VEPGDVFFMNGADAPRNFLRVGFTSIRPEHIEPGIARLAKVVDRYRGRAADGKQAPQGPDLHALEHFVS